MDIISKHLFRVLHTSDTAAIAKPLQRHQFMLFQAISWVASAGLPFLGLQLQQWVFQLSR